MKRFFKIFPALLALLSLPVAARADQADDFIRSEMQKHQIPGLALMVLKNGKPIKNQGYGLANLEWNIPVTPDTEFEIGSLSKQFTAACVLLLARDGELELEDRISRYLKSTPPAWSNITIRHLLNHTSGIKSYTGLDGFELTKHLTQVQFVQKIGALPLSFAPGDAWSYSNTGYSLLGFIVQNVAKKSYWVFLRERILLPLGMNSTGNRNPGDIIPRRAAGYELSTQINNQITNHVLVNRDYDLTDVFSAGAIVSTALDLAKWNVALDGEKFFSPAVQALWWAPTRLKNGQIEGYGFGWHLDVVNGHRNIGHGGATSGFSSSIQRYPDDHLTIIILTNADETGIATTLAKSLATIYLTSPGRTAPSQPTVVQPAADTHGAARIKPD